MIHEELTGNHNHEDTQPNHKLADLVVSLVSGTLYVPKSTYNIFRDYDVWSMKMSWYKFPRVEFVHRNRGGNVIGSSVVVIYRYAIAKCRSIT